MNKKLIIKSTEESRKILHYNYKKGDTAEIISETGKDFFLGKCYVLEMFDGGTQIIGKSEISKIFEDFIEPSFKVGQVFTVINELGLHVPIEIISVKLNKRKKTYINMIYSLDDGSYTAVSDSLLKVAIEKVIQ